MRWSRCVGTVPPPRTRPPSTVRLALPSRQETPFALESARDGREAVGFLHPKLLQPLHHRAPLGEGRGDRKHRIFVDHGGRALGRNGDALQPRGAHANVADRLAAGEALVLDREVGVHLLQRGDEAGAGGIEKHVRDRDIGARHEQPGDDQERGGARIGRNGDRLRLQLRPPDEADDRRAVARRARS